MLMMQCTCCAVEPCRWCVWDYWRLSIITASPHCTLSC